MKLEIDYFQGFFLTEIGGRESIRASRLSLRPLIPCLCLTDFLSQVYADRLFRFDMG